MVQKDIIFDLVGIGSCALGYVFLVYESPAIDEKCLSRDLIIQSGGVGRNIVWDVARMGLSCSLISKVGNDTDGNRLVQDFRDMGVDTSCVVLEPGGRTPITVNLRHKYFIQDLHP